LVAYSPPDRVILTVGASFRTEPLLKAAERIRPHVKRDLKALTAVGIPPSAEAELQTEIDELKSIWSDPRAKKHDTPLQMNEVAEIMARIRSWLKALRAIGLVNLGLDAPAVQRIASVAPEVLEGYARDVLADLELRIEAARDLKPRLEEVGLTEAFLGKGRTLARQLKTAIGAEDVDAANLHFTVRRLYMRKGQTYIVLKRLSRAGLLVFIDDPARAAPYQLSELETP
jgi:hypothetical protein